MARFVLIQVLYIFCFINKPTVNTVYQKIRTPYEALVDEYSAHLLYASANQSSTVSGGFKQVAT